MNKKEMLNIVYDTLMNNNQYQHLYQLNIDEQCIDNQSETITFEHGNKEYCLHISEVSK